LTTQVFLLGAAEATAESATATITEAFATIVSVQIG
jgi:UDP-N-acetyl-D-mannosaminuronic acid transferase (WecB/TagA/CpsF family)